MITRLLARLDDRGQRRRVRTIPAGRTLSVDAGDPCFRGADFLRRLEHYEVAFITLTRFDSLAAMKAFAGDDYETPVLEPQALALLARYERRALHFDTASFTA